MTRGQDASGGEFVLVVDDCVDDFEIIRRAIQRAVPSADVRWAADGREALSILRSPGVAIPKLLLMDYRMPAVSGLETIEAIRGDTTLPMFPIVMVAGRISDQDLDRVYRAGANSWIEKQTDFLAFMADLESVARYWLGLNQPIPAEARVNRRSVPFMSA